MAIVTALNLVEALNKLYGKGIERPSEPNQPAIEYLKKKGATQEQAEAFLREINQKVMEQAQAKATKPAPAKPKVKPREDLIRPKNVFMFRKMLLDLGYPIPECETKEGSESGDIEGYRLDLNDMIEFLNYESKAWGKPLDLKLIPPRNEVIEDWNAWNKQQTATKAEQAKSTVAVVASLPELSFEEDLPVVSVPVVVPPADDDLDAILAQQPEKPQEQAKPVLEDVQTTVSSKLDDGVTEPGFLQRSNGTGESSDSKVTQISAAHTTGIMPKAQPMRLTVPGIAIVVGLIVSIVMLVVLVVIPGKVFVTKGIALEPTETVLPTATVGHTPSATLAPTITVVPSRTLVPTNTPPIATATAGALTGFTQDELDYIATLTKEAKAIKPTARSVKKVTR